MANIVSNKIMSKWLLRSNADFPAAQLLISSHGIQAGSSFIVPKKTRIWFFCPDGYSLSDSGILNFSSSNTHPYEIYEEGTICPNYELQHYERDRYVDESIARFTGWMADRVLSNQVRSDSKTQGIALSAKTQSALTAMDQGMETRPLDILTVEPAAAVPWYSFKSAETTTLQDILRWNDSLGMFDG